MAISPRRRTDLTIAFAVYALIGVFVGVAVGIFTGDGWAWTGVGLVLGLLFAWRRVRVELRKDAQGD